jgi:hypothetical protein
VARTALTQATAETRGEKESDITNAQRSCEDRHCVSKPWRIVSPTC